MGLTSALSLVGDADALRVLFLKDGLVSDHVFENAHTKEREREGAGWCRKQIKLTYLARLNVTLLKDLLEDVILLCASTKLIL